MVRGRRETRNKDPSAKFDCTPAVSIRSDMYDQTQGSFNMQANQTFRKCRPQFSWEPVVHGWLLLRTCVRSCRSASRYSSCWPAYQNVLRTCLQNEFHLNSV